MMAKTIMVIYTTEDDHILQDCNKVVQQLFLNVRYNKWAYKTAMWPMNDEVVFMSIQDSSILIFPGCTWHTDKTD